MPRIWKPREHSLYRIASIALFRALLTQCRAATLLSPEQRVAAQHVVRNRFKHNAREVSVRRTKHMYLAGYHALDLLDASVAGEQDATNTLQELLSRTKDALKQAAPPRLSKDERKRQRQEEAGHDPRTLACLPEGQKMLDFRPVLDLDGRKRHVPGFPVVNRLPFLRTKKPQPPNLERVIRQKLLAKHNTTGKYQVLHGFHIPLAEMEDRWDEIVADEQAVRGGGDEQDEEKEVGGGRNRREPRWSAVVLHEKDAMNDMMTLEKEKSWELAKRMRRLWLQEKDLAWAEQQQEAR